jgi:O-antigen ligase
MSPLQYYLLRRLELVFCFFALLLLMGAMAPFMVDQWGSSTMSADFSSLDRQISQGNIRFQVIMLGVFVIGLLAILAERSRVPALLIGNWFLVALIGLALFSSLWSYYPDASFRRSFALMLTCTFSLYVVLRFTPKELLDLLAVVFMVASVGSIVFALALPAWGLQPGGEWRGMFGHKNDFGRMMTFGIIVFILQIMMTRPPRSWLALLGLAVSGFGMLMSSSMTAVAMTVGLVLILLLLQRLRASRTPLSLRLSIISIVAGVGVIVFLTHFVTYSLDLLGRDLTFTGRTTIWFAALEAGGQHPILGAGYRTFWTPLGAEWVYARIWGIVGHGHNGYLDLWLELGFAGFGLFLVCVVVAGKRMFSRLVSTRDVPGLFYPLLLAFLLIASMATSAHLLEQNELIWMLFVTSLLYLTPRKVTERTG